MLGQGRIDEAKDVYGRLAAFGPSGASMSASGLADVAIYQGRYSDAAAILQAGAMADVNNNNRERAAVKLAVLAHVQVYRDNGRAAAAAAEEALTHSRAVGIRLLAARAFVETGNTERAKGIANTLAMELEPEPQAYAKIVEGEIALKSGEARTAVTLFEDANKRFDTWIGHFDLGRAYLQIDGAETRADSEFDACLKRRGEAMALFLDEQPTYGFLPIVYYYQGQVREKIGTTGYRDSYKQYFTIRGNSTEDRPAREVLKKLGS